MGDSRNPSEQTWEERASSHNTKQREAVASDESAPVNLLNELAEDNNDLVRAAVAENPSTPAATLRVLSRDNSSYVRSVVAVNLKASGRILEDLARDESKHTRLFVALNPSTPDRVLLTLARDEWHGVRDQVAKASPPPEALRVLAGDAVPEIRTAVASNPATPMELLNLLRKAGADENLLEVGGKPKTLTKAEREFLFDLGPYGRLLLAAHPETSAKRLRMLVTEGNVMLGAEMATKEGNIIPVDSHERICDSDFQLAVAQNTNAPIDVLCELAEKMPEPVLSNPGFREAVESDPSILTEVSESEMAELLELETVPVECLRLFSQHENYWIRSAIASNPSAPPEVLVTMAQDDQQVVRHAVASNPSTPPEVLVTIAQDDDQGVVHAVASNISVPEDQLRTLAKLNTEIRAAVASNTAAPEDVLRTLADDLMQIRKEVGGNPLTPAEIRTNLFCRDVPGYLEKWERDASKDPTTPAYVLSNLSSHDDSAIRAAVGKNPSTPTETLHKLAADGKAYVRSMVAQNRFAPAEALSMLAADTDFEVRMLASSNSNTPDDIIDLLMKAGADEDLKQVGVSPRGLTEVEWARLFEAGQYGRALLAAHPQTTGDQLATLGRENQKMVRLAVAQRQSTPAATLHKLSTLNDFDICKALAENPSASGDLLRKLAAQCGTEIFPYLLSNTSASVDFLFGLMNKHNEFPQSNLRFTVASNPATRPDLLARLSTDPEWQLRRCVASNPATPPDILAKLRTDVRAAVQEAAELNSNVPKVQGSPPEGLFDYEHDDWEVSRSRIRDYFAFHPERLRVYKEAIELNSRLCDLRSFKNKYRENCIVALERSVNNDFRYDLPFSLDLHGFEGREAKKATQLFIDFASEASIPKVRIIHGRGQVLSTIIPPLIKAWGLSAYPGGRGKDIDCDDKSIFGHLDVQLPHRDEGLWPIASKFMTPSGRWSKPCATYSCDRWVIIDPHEFPEPCPNCGAVNERYLPGENVLDGNCLNCNSLILIANTFDPIRQQCPKCQCVLQASRGHLKAVDTLDPYQEGVDQEEPKGRNRKHEERLAREAQKRQQAERASRAKRDKYKRGKEKDGINNSFAFRGVFFGILVGLPFGIINLYPNLFSITLTVFIFALIGFVVGLIFQKDTL